MGLIGKGETTRGEKIMDTLMSDKGESFKRLENSNLHQDFRHNTIPNTLFLPF